VFGFGNQRGKSGQKGASLAATAHNKGKKCQRGRRQKAVFFLGYCDRDRKESTPGKAQDYAPVGPPGKRARAAYFSRIGQKVDGREQECPWLCAKREGGQEDGRKETKT